MRRYARRTGLTLLLGMILALGLTKAPIRPVIDGDGYWRDPSLWAVVFPSVEGAYRYSIIKSIQRGTVTINGASASGTATITSVTTANSIVAVGGHSGDASNDYTSALAQGPYRLELTNATTVTATQGAATPNAAVAPYQVVEYYGSVLTANAVQRGTLTLSAATSNTATITSVTTTKAYNVWGGWSAGGSNYNTTSQGNWWPRIVLTNATTLTGTCAATCTVTMPYQVVEFK